MDDATPQDKAPPQRAEDPAELLAKHASGDADAFARFVSLYRARVYTYLVRFGVRESARDDLFQEIFLKVHLNASRYNKKLPVMPWLFTIVANTVRSAYRKEGTRTKHYTAEESIEQPDEMSAQHAAEAKETADFLVSAMHALPQEQREVLLLSSLASLEQDQIARTLKMSINTVKTNLRRARLHLAEALHRKQMREQREVSQ